MLSIQPGRGGWGGGAELGLEPWAKAVEGAWLVPPNPFLGHLKWGGIQVLLKAKSFELP